MIEELRIRGLGVIDDAVVEFGPGLTAITGETGAGKTMVLSSLALLAGGRADAGLVRAGERQAWVDGAWQLPAGSPAIERLAEAGADLEADEVPEGAARVILGRTVAAEGRSRALAGGRSVPVAVLQEATTHLLAVHGQADQQHLRSAEAQRQLLDRFGGPALQQRLEQAGAAHAAWRAVRGELESLRAGREARRQESAMLALGIAEIEALAPEPGEDAALDREAARLQHAGSLLADVRQAHDALVGSEDDLDASSLMHAVDVARHALDRAVAVDDGLAELRGRLGELTAVAADLAVELAAYAAGIDADPAHQAGVEERRAALQGLRRRHGGSVDQALAWLEQARHTVAEVSEDDQRVSDLQAQEESLRARLAAAVHELTSERQAAADRLATAVTAELAELALPDAEFEARVETTADPDRWTAQGADHVEFRLRPHRGGELRPVAKSASGGELSRVMLALEVVLAGVDPVPTFVFDEVDAGIGGRAAVEVGRRLARLARTAQVVVVTHLPQVAAFADTQVVVSKGADGLVTTSSVRAVAGPERIAELVRMLSGLDASEAGAAHAEELLALAAGERC